MAISFKGYAGIGFAAAIGLAASASLPTYAQEKGSIKIGLMLPYKGVYGPLAENIDRGFQIALEEYGNKTSGRPIEIIRADDELTPTVGVQKFNKFVQSDTVDLVAVVIGSNVAMRNSDLADKNNMPMLFANSFVA